jgi:hypothetical protein
MENLGKIKNTIVNSNSYGGGGGIRIVCPKT